MLVSNCCTVVAPVASIESRSTLMTLAPTGASPLMLVPVTVTVSTLWSAGAAGCAYAPPDMAASPMAAEPSNNQFIRGRVVGECLIVVRLLCAGLGRADMGKDRTRK